MHHVYFSFSHSFSHSLVISAQYFIVQAILNYKEKNNGY